MPRRYVEVTVPATVDAGELLGHLGGDALGAWENEGFLHLCWPEGCWNPLVLEDLKEALLRLGAGDAAARLSVHVLPDQDWNALWSSSLVPIRIGRRFRIRQSWNPPDPSFDGIELVIEPKRAFGTGYHATTQLVVEWLEEHVCGGERLLDIGTGTGILAMAALRLGARSALGVDNDPVAVECASENASANGFGPEIEFRTGSFDVLGAETFDLIAANLDRNTILRLCRNLESHLRHGGTICLSGLQSDDLPEVASAVTAVGGRIVDRRERDEWMAVTVRF